LILSPPIPPPPIAISRITPTLGATYWAKTNLVHDLYWLLKSIKHLAHL